MSKVEQKDLDITIINHVRRRLSEDSRLCFVVSGSYAIEALTRSDSITHSDIDSNVFTQDSSAAMKAIPALLSRRHVSDVDFSLYKLTSDRIEYDVQANVECPECPKSRLEIHVLSAKSIEEMCVILDDSAHNRLARVDLTETELADSAGNSSKILVKSLAYSVATWALRISDAAQNQLRPVRQSDIDSFMLLLEQGTDSVDVIKAMENHPQMPMGANAQEIYQSALTKVGKSQIKS